VELGGETFLTLHEIRNERCGYLGDHGAATFFAGYFRPVVNDLEAVVNEIRRGKTHKIKADKFDRQCIHSSFPAASSSLSMQRDGATPPSGARPAGEVLAALASPAHSSRAAALRGRSAAQPRLTWTRQTPCSRGLKMAQTAALIQESFKTMLPHG